MDLNGYYSHPLTNNSDSTWTPGHCSRGVLEACEITAMPPYVCVVTYFWALTYGKRGIVVLWVEKLVNIIWQVGIYIYASLKEDPDIIRRL